MIDKLEARGRIRHIFSEIFEYSYLIGMINYGNAPRTIPCGIPAGIVPAETPTGTFSTNSTSTGTSTAYWQFAKTGKWVIFGVIYPWLSKTNPEIKIWATVNGV